MRCTALVMSGARRSRLVSDAEGCAGIRPAAYSLDQVETKLRSHPEELRTWIAAVAAQLFAPRKRKGETREPRAETREPVAEIPVERGMSPAEFAAYVKYCSSAGRVRTDVQEPYRFLVRRTMELSMPSE